MKFIMTTLLFCFCWLNTASVFAEDSDKKPLLDKFYCGFYVGKLTEEVASRMSKAGFNVTYVGGSLLKESERQWPGQATEKDFITSLEMAKKYKMKLIVQPASYQGYFFPNYSEADIKNKVAPKAIAFLKKYASEPEFLAYGPKEEPRIKDLEKLSFYYKEIKKEVPSVNLYLIHNRLESAFLQPQPYPDIMGADKYPFFYTDWLGLKMPTPRFALEWYRRRCNQYWLASTFSRKMPMVSIITGKPVWEYRLTGEAFAKLPGGRQEEIKGFVENKKLGWLYNKELNVYTRPCWYRAPKNCMRGMAWISVMEGAKMLLHWSWAEWTEIPEERLFKKSFSLRLNDEQFEEYAEACRTFRKFENIILNMVKERIPLMECDDPFLCHRTHFLKGGKGTIQVLVNSDVGSWFGNQKNRFPKEGQFFSVDDQGSIVEYTPETSDKKYEFSILKNEEDRVWNLLEKKEMKSALRDGVKIYSLDLMPGDGTFLFTGSEEQYNALAIK